jgi:hypothetical protein
MKQTIVSRWDSSLALIDMHAKLYPADAVAKQADEVAV